jgi:hypothetical protein
MLENQTQYRFRQCSASQYTPRFRMNDNNKNADLASAFEYSMVAETEDQVSSSSSLQLRFTCSLQLR